MPRVAVRPNFLYNILNDLINQVSMVLVIAKGEAESQYTSRGRSEAVLA
jgi:hypothetical protein